MVIHISETLAFNYNQHIQQQIIEICNNKKGTDSRCTLRTERGIIVIDSKNFFCTRIDLLRGQSKSNQLINRCKYPPNGCGKNQLPPHSYILQMPVYWGERDAALSAMLNRKYWSFLTVLKSPLITQGHWPKSFIKRLQYHWIYHLG